MHLALIGDESSVLHVLLRSRRGSEAIVLHACSLMQVAINTSIPEVGAFLDHIVQSTNMRCLTPRSALSGDCGFLAANLYAKSVFGEDALVNVSAEQLQGGKIGGYIRIRWAWAA